VNNPRNDRTLFADRRGSKLQSAHWLQLSLNTRVNFRGMTLSFLLPC